MTKEIIVYSTPLCAPCEQLKHFLKKEGVEFKVKDLMMDEEAADLMQKNGIRSAPALGVDDKIFHGADLTADTLRTLINHLKE
ncbi:MAG: glutaredoxin family protein [Thermodesulfobacteriota bacterium]|nr:glutaredoxin family protein [Thermodesulfobacteriota bacterium]